MPLFHEGNSFNKRFVFFCLVDDAIV